MKFEQLLYLKKVYEHHSIALACETLHITRQALSASLKKLEQELDTPLFIRTVRGVDLTPKGYEVLMFAESILEQQQAFMQRFYDANTPSTLAGNILCICQYLPRALIFPDLTTYFINHYPNIRVNTITISDRQQLLTQLSDESATIGFIYQFEDVSIRQQPLPENLCFHLIAPVKLFIWCSVTSQIGSRSKINYTDIAHCPILYDEKIGNFWDNTLFKIFGPPPVKTRLPSTRDPGVLEKFLENNSGILWDMGTNTRSVYQYLIANPHLRRIPVQMPPEIALTIGYVLPSKESDDPALHVLINYLENLELQ